MNSHRLEDNTVLNGRYRILRSLGRGGMGTVYLAEHEQLRTLLAIKELERSTGEEAQDELKGYVQEATLLVKLKHPNLPLVTDAFIENGRFYLVMDYIEGVTLESLIRQSGTSGLDCSRVVDWSLQIAEVLSYLHQQVPPVIFRDVKPANIMLQPDGMVKLIDFGIARRFNEGAGKDTTLLGSVGYSPPEQFGRQQTDMRSDIYAFGATLHHLVTGVDPSQHPFKFKPAAQLNPDVPPQLSELIARCVQIDPDSRPDTMEEVFQELRNVRDRLTRTLGAQLLPESATGRNNPPKITSANLAKPRQEPSKSISVVLGTMIALLMLAGVAYFVWQVEQRKPASKPHTKSSAPQSLAPSPSQPQAMTQAAPTMPGTTTPPSTDASTIRTYPIAVQAGNGAVLLQVGIEANILGHASSTATLAVFFYYPDGSPVLAADPHSAFANPDGQLSLAIQHPVTTDNQEFNDTLRIPLSQFPQALFAPGAQKEMLQMRGLLLVDGERFHTAFVPIDVQSLAQQEGYIPLPSSPTAGNAPNNSASPQPSTAPSSQGGTGYNGVSGQNTAPQTGPPASGTTPPGAAGPNSGNLP